MKLSTKFTLITFLIFGSIISLIFILQNVFINSYRNENITNEVKSFSNGLSIALQEALMKNDFNDLNKIISSYEHHTEFDYIIVQDNLGTILARTKNTNYFDIDSVLSYNKKDKIYDLEIGNKKVYQILKPIYEDKNNSNSTVWGYIIIGFNKNEMNRFYSKFIDQNLILLVLGLGIVSLSALLLSNYIKNPLIKLTSAAKQITEGNYNTKVEIIRKDEIGLLAKAFNKMSDKINDDFINLSEQNTELIKAKNDLIWLSRVAEQVGEGIIVTDLIGVIIFANNSWKTMHGYSEDIDLKGMHISNFFTEEDFTKIILPLYENVIIQKRTNIFVNTLSMKKDLIPTEITSTLLIDVKENNVGVIFIAIDKTKQLEAERLLIEAKENAEKSDKLKTEFLAQMSHEIRTPLNNIVSFSSLIHEEVENKISEELSRGFNVIDEASKRIIRTIELILNVSELQTGNYHLNIKSLDIVEDILKNVYYENKVYAQLKDLEFLLNVKTNKTIINSDQYSLEQIFSHLVNNAIKFTYEGKVEIVVYRNEQNFLCVDIIDSGIGISDEFLPNLFQPFTQEDIGYTRKYEGNGLGLTLVKKYCELNNAEVIVKSKKNSGTTFTIIFKNSNLVETS